MESEPSAPAPDGAASPSPAAPLDLPILQAVRAAQAQHGLRHGDFKRYRSFCTKKLRRLYRSLKLSHGRGRFVKRDLAVADVAESSHLAVFLFSAERAWAHAQERKAALGPDPDADARRGVLSRLTKAVAWGRKLVAAAAGVGATPRTVVEAAAYSAWLDGGLGVERKGAWAPAAASLARAQQLCDRLAAVGPAEARAAARQQLADIQPVARFCAYQGERGGAGGGGAKGTGTATPPSPDPAVDAALAALEAGGAAGDDAGAASGDAYAAAAAAAGFTTLAWRGGQYPVNSERVRSSLAAAHEAAARAAAANSLDARVAALDAAVAALGEAKGAVRASLAAAGATGSGAAAAQAAADARQLALAVTGLQLERLIERGLALAADAAARLERALQAGPDSKAAGGSGGGAANAAPGAAKPTAPAAAPASARRARPDDLVRLCDALLKSCKQLADVAAGVGGAAGELLLDECAARAAEWRARRAYYAAHAHLNAGKPADAMALFGRAVERAGQAVDAHSECSRPDAAALEALDGLQASAGVWRGVAHAQAAARDAAAVDDAEGRVGGLALGGDGAPAAPTAAVCPVTFLAGGLDEWQSFASGGPGDAPRLAPLPPRPQLVPVRPFVLDIAFDGIAPPDLGARVPKEAAAGTFGAVTKLFSWRRQ